MRQQGLGKEEELYSEYHTELVQSRIQITSQEIILGLQHILKCRLLQHRFYRSYLNVGFFGGKLLITHDYQIGIKEVINKKLC